MWPKRSPETNTPPTDDVHGLSDESLVEAAQRGYSPAFDALSKRYRQQLFRAAHRITRTIEDAEDAVQDTLLSAFLHVREFDGRSGFGTWLTRIAINSALMILRKKRTTQEIATDYNDEFVAEGLHYKITDHRPNPEIHYAQREEAFILKKAIHGLRPALRAAVQLQYPQECSIRETAEAIGISTSAAKGRLFHAKKALRRSLMQKLAHPLRPDRRVRALPAGQWLGQGEGASKSTAIQSQGRGR